MITRIVYPTALEYWLEEKGLPYRYQNPFSSESSLSGRREISEVIKSLSFSCPVHIAVPASIYRNRTKSIVAHKIPRHLPENSFISISDFVEISSPELCFLQAAEELPMHELVRLACDLCAIYVLDTFEEYGQRRREPITSVEAITEYLKKAQRIHGSALAQRAIRYALNRSNSPMESRLAVVAVLPLHYGGYGIKKPFLNYETVLTAEGKEYLGRETCCCDMVWPEEKVVLEYDSNLAHSTLRQVATDKKRIAALAISGYKVISVTTEQVKNFRNIESLFLGVRKALKIKNRKERLEKHFEKRWDVVHEMLLTKPDTMRWANF